jgi:hypothetical protein
MLLALAAGADEGTAHQRAAAADMQTEAADAAGEDV